MSEDPMTPAFSSSELERRRAASRRLGWLLGIVVLAIYLLGLFIKR
ncbi:MAG: hypothetical protein WAV95_11210 [Azonexus sp.]